MIIVVKKFIPVIISLIIITSLFSLVKNLDFHKSYSIFMTLDFENFAVSVIAFLVAHYFTSMKYSKIVNNYIKPKTTYRVGGINYFSLFFAHVIPIGPSADLFRIAMLKKYYNISTINGVIIALVDRLCSLIFTIIIGLIFIFLQIYFFNYFYNIHIQFIFWISILAAFLIILYLPKIILAVIKQFFKSNFKDFAGIIERTLIFTKQSCMNYQIMIYTILQIITFSIAIFFCAASVLGNNVTIIFILLSPLFQAIQSVPLFFSGWGIREVAFINFINFSNTSNNEIFVISFVVGLSIFVSTLPSGFFLLRDRINAKLKKN